MVTAIVHHPWKTKFRGKLNVLVQSSETTPTVLIESLVKDIERNLWEGLQLSPNHPYLLMAEAQLADLFDDSSRALDALEKAFKGNPRSTFVALRLSSYYKKHGDLKHSREILEQALEANPGEAKLHFAFSKLLILDHGATSDVLLYHLKRSFTEGDSSYDAQLLYGRQLFINGDLENWKKIFRRLGDARVSHEVRTQLSYPLEQTFNGSVVSIEATYCFIARDGLNEWIHAHRSNIGDHVWKALTVESRVTFRIAFTMKGPSGFDVYLAS